MWRLAAAGLVLAGLAAAAGAQGTKLWSVGRYDEMLRGRSEGVAIRSDGRMSPGLAASPFYTAGASYVWSVAAGADGAAYVGLGGSTAGSAAVVRVGVDGRAEKVFEGKELAVQAVRLGADGAVYAATSPEGKVYRLGRPGAAAEVVFDPAATAEKPRYLWDLAVGKDGAVYVAAGAPAAVYRVVAGAGGGSKAELLFRTADQHIRCLQMAADGTLWAGSDGAGVIYKVLTTKAGAKPFAAYAAGRREITALAIGAGGEVYAAAVGAKGGSTLPPLPVTGNAGVTVTFVQPGSAAAAGANNVVPEGSEIDRIAVDGTPSRLVTLRDDVVYALAVRGGEVLAATGNHGRVYRIEPRVPGRFTEVARVEAGQATAFAAAKDGLLVGTSNGGKVVRIGDAPTGASTYVSEVFDAGQIARWGRVEVQYAAGAGAVPAFDVWVRTGNVPSSIEGWADWVKVRPNVDVVGGTAGVPPGRYAQWKADLRAGAEIDAVGLNYLPRNVAPVVDEVVVAMGARVAAAPAAATPATVQVSLPAAAAGAAQAISFVQDTGAAPLTAQKDKTAVTVRWAAHDDNGDDLMFAVWYRGDHETVWRLLKDKISERYLSFDSALLPDGSYVLKVVASDAPVHVDGEALTGDRESAGFTVDTTPPVPGPLVARMEAGVGSSAAGSGAKVRVTFEARDQTSPIAHAEYSVDAGPWQYVEPVGGLSDSLGERYDFLAAVPATAGLGAGAGVVSAAEHVIAVRVYDRFENMASVKAVVR